MDAAQYLCRFDELRDGEARGFAMRDGAAPKVFIVRRNGQLYCYWDACPHYGGTPMAWRTHAYLNSSGDRIVCASHGAEFDIETGRCSAGAALGQSLTRAPVETRSNGELFLMPGSFLEK